MFDKAIIDTDTFMDLGMSSKALYFLLGMDADDEGFVSYKKIMRVHGGNEDDLKVLLAKGFLISFPSGVVVITDWNRNNYLDKNRIKETEYQKEKKLLVLTNNGKYELNNSLTRVEESRVEESRITALATRETELPDDSGFEKEELSVKELARQNKIKSLGHDPALTNQILKWAEEKRGSPFINKGKQLKNISGILAVKRTFEDIKEKWQEMSLSEWWSKGFDFADIANQLDKGKSEIISNVPSSTKIR